jgi:hypothetical protein
MGMTWSTRLAAGCPMRRALRNGQNQILDRPGIRRILTQVAPSAALPMDRLRRVFDCGSTSPPRSPAG